MQIYVLLLLAATPVLAALKHPPKPSRLKHPRKQSRLKRPHKPSPPPGVLARFSESTPPSVFFLHFPRCGSSFHNTLARFACRDVPDDCVLGEYEGCEHKLTNGTTVFLRAAKFSCSPIIPEWAWFGHTPLFGLAQAPQAVALFRQPRMRLLASVRHPAGVPPAVDRLLRSASQLELLNERLTDAEVVRLPGKLGCMTKMLTGLHCGEPVLNMTEYTEITDRFIRLRRAGHVSEARAVLDESVVLETRLLMNRVPEALAVVDALLFVGLTEMWDLSVALFHAQVAHHGKVVAAELHNMRPGIYSPFHEDVAQLKLHNLSLDMIQPPHVYDARALDGLWDPADEQVFLAAESRMSRDASAIIGVDRHRTIDV